MVDTSVISQAVAKKGAQGAAAADFLSVNPYGVTMPTLYELRRGLLKLHASDQGARKRVAVELVLQDAATILDPSRASPSGWELAAEIWASAALMKPSVVFSEIDLLIGATAFAHGGTFVTADLNLAARLTECGFHDRLVTLA